MYLSSIEERITNDGVALLLLLQVKMCSIIVQNDDTIKLLEWRLYYVFT